MIRKWVAIRYPAQGIYGEETPHTGLIALDRNPESNRIYWNGGTQWSTMPQGAEIIHDYGMIDENDDDLTDSIFAHYDREIAPPVPVDFDRLVICDIVGFIAPDGTVYRAAYTDHSATARTLVEYFQIKTDPDVVYHARHIEALRRHGWITIQNGGYLSGDTIPTEQQMTSINRLIDINHARTAYQVHMKWSVDVINRVYNRVKEEQQ